MTNLSWSIRLKFNLVTFRFCILYTSSILIVLALSVSTVGLFAPDLKLRFNSILESLIKVSGFIPGPFCVICRKNVKFAYQLLFYMDSITRLL